MDNELLKYLIPNAEGFKLDRIEETESEITLFIEAENPEGKCPICGTPSTKVKTTYTRKIQHLPCSGRSVKTVVKIHQFKCENPDCLRKSFAEELPFAEKWQQRSKQLNEKMLLTIAECGYSGTVRIMRESGVKVGISSTGRLFSRVEFVKEENLTFVGIDDVSKVKGNKYFSVIYSGITHNMITMEDGRNGDAIEDYLKANLQLEFVARDRSSSYASTTRKILPKCAQVADRFHLVKNLQDYLKDRLKATLKKEYLIPKPPDEWERERKKAALETRQKLTAQLNNKNNNYNNTLVLDCQGQLSPEPFYFISKKTVISYILTGRENRSEKASYCLDYLKEVDATVFEALNILDSFRVVIKSGRVDMLDCFMEFFKDSSLANSFIGGIKYDFEAVSNAVKYQEISSGFVEGNNNKLKLIQRKGFGNFSKENLVKMFKLSHSVYYGRHDYYLKPKARKYYCVRKQKRTTIKRLKKELKEAA